MAIEVGSIIEGKITGIAKFGAFMELEKGKFGLIHISEIADSYVNDVHDFLREGDKVQAKVINIDTNGRVALSIKQLKQKQTKIEKIPPKQNTRSKLQLKQQRPQLSQQKTERSLPETSFEDKLSKFLKDSNERLLDLKRKMDSKRGGRGSKHSD